MRFLKELPTKTVNHEEIEMYNDLELRNQILSKQITNLKTAIGTRLQDIERWFVMPEKRFLKDKRFAPIDFFPFNSGPAQFFFENNHTHTFDVYGEQLSLVLLPSPIQKDDFAKAYRLSTYQPIPDVIRSCLNKTCIDVRFWQYNEPVESFEAKEAAISYLFQDNTELFYCIYLHGDLDTDYLLMSEDIPLETVSTGFSIRQDKFITFNST